MERLRERGLDDLIALMQKTTKREGKLRKIMLFNYEQYKITDHLLKS
ncbi:hypothetical protein OVS_02180 [Mycoplasma ovis str. Michigan]|uniref:Transposase n=1 Tax=Mycoplasma ovis str. Michigan TaxID=1415773 RepID=A0ABN4BN41_9MOLU|nr:hypothetical protein OVS_02180 [Mycoplasma ovis str. Michigan]